jgi:hypothetical protein
MGMVVPASEYNTLREEAKKHTTFETFQKEMLRLAESIWHHSRREGEAGSEADPGDVSEDAPKQEAPAETQPAEVTPETTPPAETVADPAPQVPPVS